MKLKTPHYYVSDSGDTDQQCLVAYGEDGGAVLDSSSIPKLLACHGLDLPPDVPLGVLAELVTAARNVEYGSRIAGKAAALRHGAGVQAIRRILASLDTFGKPSPPPASDDIGRDILNPL